MTDIERAREKRARELELAVGRETVSMAENAIHALQDGTTAASRVTALSLAILAIADEAGADREAVIEAFADIARKTAGIELVRV